MGNDQRKSVLFVAFCLFFGCVFSSTKNGVCNMTHSCTNKPTLDCSHLNSTLKGRCCIGKDNKSITGIDLSHCNISEVDDMFQNLCELKKLYLQDNPLKSNLTRQEFVNVTQLDLLVLPHNMECPGGEKAWESTTITDGNMHCISEQDTCNVNNVTCPSSTAECKNSGPGMTSCYCKPGYHGYKCLRQGRFPVEIYIISLGCSTVVLCVLLWCTQRRKAKKLD